MTTYILLLVLVVLFTVYSIFWCSNAVMECVIHDFKITMGIDK